MTPRTIQYAIAAVFFVLGGWCLIAPQSVIDLTVRPDYRPDDAIAPLLVGCFGAQACLAGLFAAFSIFTRATFLAYGVAVLPFFGFNYYFYFVEPVFNELILLDAAGNLIFLVLCVLGYRRLSPAPR
ncbi:hypothetical protein [Vitreimonas sp.]|uniref:hypothetical protein n=1 Tax=Vitreimonas sp. TaxID=3069702 RepID=UPI002ED7AE6C